MTDHPRTSLKEIPPTTAATARRLQHARYGGPEVLELAEVPLPEPGPGQVRVRVHAAGANGLDSKMRQGLFAPGQVAPAEPAPLGIEMAGVIDATGAEVTGWSIGQAVLGRTAERNAVAGPRCRNLPLSIELTGDPAKVITIADLRAAEHGVHFSTEILPIPQVMAEVLPLIEAGSVHMPIEAIFPLEEAADAYRLLDGGHLRGKVVINTLR